MRWALLLRALFVAALFVAGCGAEDGRETSIVVDVAADPIVVRTAAARVEIARTPARIAIYDAANGTLLTREQAAEGLFFERDGVTHHLEAVVRAIPFPEGVDLECRTTAGDIALVSVRFRSDHRIEVSLSPGGATSQAMGVRFASPRDEKVYGLTERLRDSSLQPGSEIPVGDIRPAEVGSLDRRGEVVEMFIRPTFSLYAPFYQSSRGYGVAVAGTMPGVYDVAHADPDSIRMRFEVGSDPRFVLNFFVGPEHATILDEYTAWSGRPLVPPDWAFLNWHWRDELDVGAAAMLDGVEVNAEVADDVLNFEELGIPAGVYLLDRPVLQGNFGFARFAWDSQRLPNAASMLASLKRRGYHVVTWSSTWLCGSQAGDNGLEAQQLGFIAPGPAGAPNCADSGGASFIMDVTNPAARGWFRDKLAAFLRSEGLDGIKLDRGEEHIPSASSDIWFDGRNGREVHNDYVNLQTELHYDALDQAHPDGDFVLFSRSGYTGAQSHAIFWGGDTAGSEIFGIGSGTDLGLRSVIIAQQRAAFMGFPIWGSDTGGYYGFKNREVFARWIELSCFSGVMEIGGRGSHEPWNMPTSPRFDDEMIEIYRRYATLRASLQSYIVAAAEQASRGMPLARPMVFFDRDDPNLGDRWDQYLFGADLMVAPVWKIGVREREVYFPRGRWRSLWNEAEVYEGPRTLTLPVALDDILVFIRGDAPTPLHPPE